MYSSSGKKSDSRTVGKSSKKASSKKTSGNNDPDEGQDRKQQPPPARQTPDTSKTVSGDPPDESTCAWLSLASCLLRPAQQQKILQCIEHPLELFPDSPQSAMANPVARKLLRLAAPARGRRGEAATDRTNNATNATNATKTNSERLALAATFYDRALVWSQHPAHHLIALDSPRYPSLLKEIPDPPVMLFVIGNPNVLHLPQLAIVGSRRATPAARRIARDFSSELAAQGLTITSGLARGIDQEAHQGSLDAGGHTVAVLATGPDRCYPSEHQSLLNEVTTLGAAVTEYPPGIAPAPRNFPQRNRIISGLSLGSLIVEASTRSGTLVTARHAMEQNREVFAIPGTILNPQAQGCHLVIQQGAKLTCQVSDITDELGISGAPALTVPTPGPDGTPQEHPGQSAQSQPAESPKAAALLELAGYDPVTIDQLVLASNYPVEEIMSLLLELELNSRISSLGDGRYVRC